MLKKTDFLVPCGKNRCRSHTRFSCRKNTVGAEQSTRRRGNLPHGQDLQFRRRTTPARLRFPKHSVPRLTPQKTNASLRQTEDTAGQTADTKEFHRPVLDALVTGSKSGRGADPLCRPRGTFCPRLVNALRFGFQHVRSRDATPARRLLHINVLECSAVQEKFLLFS